MKSGKPRPDNDAPLSGEDIEGAVRVFQSLEKLVARPRLVDSLQAKPDQLLILAKRFRDFRIRRHEFFEAELFGEPGWDILLSLYIGLKEGYRQKVSSVCNESGVADTTAIRWIETLRELGLIDRRRNPIDARSTFIELTPLGAEKMDRLLQLVWQNYFPFE